MSVQAITCALAVRGVSSSEKLLLLALANYADDKMGCWPSQKRLADDCCLTERTVRSLLSALEARGMLSRQEHRRPDGSRSTDRITLHFSGVVVTGTEQQPEIISGGGEMVSGGTGNGFRGVPEMVSGPTTFEPSFEPSDEPPRAGDGFDEFWRAYPNKVGKVAARAAYGRALKRKADPLVMLASVIRAKGSDRWRRGFIPNPATWLNEGRWDDEPAERATPPPQRVGFV